MRCWWNASAQVFNGPGCVAANETNCLCTHLTTYSAFSAPSVNVASQHQMLSVSPADILSKAKVFVIVIVVLFFALHFSAASSALADRRWRAHLRAQLFSEAFGFLSDGSKQHEAGVWRWQLNLSKDKATGTTRGPALRFAAALGIPLVRLRLSIPEELLDLSQVSGEEPPAKTIAAAAAAQEKSARSIMASTALVYALIVHLELLSPEEIITGQSKTAAHFGVLGDAREFAELVALFTEMLCNYTLTRRDSWMDAARLWRFVLLRNRKSGPLDGGGWEPSSSLAFSLFAVDLPDAQPQDEYSQTQQPVEDGSGGAPVFWQRPLRALRDHFRSRGLARAEVNHSVLRESLSWYGRPMPQQPWHAPVPVLGLDVLAFSLPAILNSVPDFLTATFEDRAFALRLWTTLLSLTVLESLTVCWASHDINPSTLLDDTEVWIENAVARHHRGGPTRGAALLRASAIPEELTAEVIEHARPLARETILRWKLAHEHRLLLLRSATHAEGGIWRSYRVLGEAVASLQQRHQAASAMLSPVADGLTRVHRAALLITSLLTALTVQTWLYWSKATTCCGQMRVLLDCHPDPLVPCRGFSGDCADLKLQFATLAHDNAHANLATSGPWAWQCSALQGLASFECHAFPDSASAHDKIYAGLITTAIALPMHHILGVLLQMSTEPDLSFSWLSMQPLLHMLTSLLRLRTLGGNWRWRGARPFFLVRYLQRYSIQPFKSVLEWVCAALAALVVRCYGHNAAARRTLEEVPPDERAATEAELRRAVARRVAGVLGLLLVYFVWAVCVWYCLTYGILLLGLLGVASEVEFLKSWAISVAVQSAYQMRYAVQALFLGLLSHFAFEQVHVAPQHSWFEVWLDSMSVQAACTATASPFAYARVHLRHFRSITL